MYRLWIDCSLPAIYYNHWSIHIQHHYKISMNQPFNNSWGSVDTAGLGWCYWFCANQFAHRQNSDCNNSTRMDSSCLTVKTGSSWVTLEGNPRLHLGNVWEKHPSSTPVSLERSAPCQKVGAPWLFPDGFTHNPSLPPHSVLCTPMEANQRGQRSTFSEAGMPREERQELETEKSYSFGSLRNNILPTARVSLLFLFS